MSIIRNKGLRLNKIFIEDNLDNFNDNDLVELENLYDSMNLDNQIEVMIKVAALYNKEKAVRDKNKKIKAEKIVYVGLLICTVVTVINLIF